MAHCGSASSSAARARGAGAETASSALMAGAPVCRERRTLALGRVDLSSREHPSRVVGVPVPPGHAAGAPIPLDRDHPVLYKASLAERRDGELVKHKARLLVAAVILLGALLPGSSVVAGPPTQRGRCGAPIPHGVRELGNGRYASARRWRKQIVFYKRVFGSRNPKYRFIHLFNIPGARALHIASFNRRTGWAGINISSYGSDRRTKIFVICRGGRRR